MRIGLEPPGDLKPSTHFPGFEDIDRKVGVTIFDLPAAAYAELERAAKTKHQHGLTDMKRENFPFRSGIGLLVTGRAQIKASRCTNGFCWRPRPADKTLPC